MIKYSTPFKSYDNNDWLLTIDLPSYTGDPIGVRGVADKAAILSYEGGTDDQWDNPIVNVSLSSSIYNQGQVDVSELQLIKDRECIVTLHRGEDVRFKGYLIADKMQRSFASAPYEVNISATSGLNLLDGIDYNSFDASYGTRCPLNFFRRILCHENNLGIDLPIRWTPTVEAIQTEIAGDAMEHAIWSNRGEGFYSVNIKTGEPSYKDCKYIIEGFTKAFKCRIVQADGAWWVIGIKEHLADVIAYRECANSTGLPVITEHTRDSVRVVGEDYMFINEDAVITVLPGLSKVSVKYEHDQRENILPNGGQDVWTLGSPLSWAQSNIELSVEEHPDITGQGGFAVELTNMGINEHTYSFVNKLPIDGNILYNRLNWGFSFMCLGGYPQDTNGFIDWKKNPIKTSVSYTVNEGGSQVTYYLNEFGYWGTKNTPANQQVVSVTWQTPSTMFIQFQQDKSFFVGDVVYIQFVRDGVVIGREVLFEETMDVASGTDFIVSKIQDGFTTSPNDWTIQINNVQNQPANSAWTEKSRDYYKYIYFTVANLKLNDSAAVTYTGAGSLNTYIVDPGLIDKDTPVGIGMLKIEFFIAKGQNLVLDDIWFSVDDNHDVYTASVSDDKNANNKEIDLKISSSFNGFYVSNLMRRYYNSNTDWLFTDGTDIGSLTELYARSVMKSRYKASEIFNGSISTRGKDWSFIDNYSIATLDGKKFIPLNPTYNTEKNEVYLIAIEDRSDAITIEVKHSGSEKYLEI